MLLITISSVAFTTLLPPSGVAPKYVLDKARKAELPFVPAEALQLAELLSHAEDATEASLSAAPATKPSQYMLADVIVSAVLRVTTPAVPISTTALLTAMPL